jgi:hypothetical protein
MWLKITPDIELTMEVDLQGVDENTRDHDVQLYEKVIRDALKKRLTRVFALEDITIYSLAAGIAREKYIRRKAA